MNVDLEESLVKVERSKTVDETVKQLSNEIIKSALIPEVLREKAEKLLGSFNTIIKSLINNNYSRIDYKNV